MSYGQSVDRECLRQVSDSTRTELKGRYSRTLTRDGR